MDGASPLGGLAVGYVLGAMLLLARVATLTVWLPGLNANSTPMRVRMMASMVLALVLDLGLGGVFLTIPESPWILGLMLIREVLIGAAMGMAVRVLLAVAEVAGSLAGISMGLSLNVMVDPTSGDQSLPLGSLLGIAAALMFVALGGHRMVLLTLYEHMSYLPVGELTLAVPKATVIAELGGHLARTALGLASPAIVVALVLNIALAFVSRAVPAVNIFGIGLSMLLLGGLLALSMEGEGLRLYMEQAVDSLPVRMVELAGEPAR